MAIAFVNGVAGFPVTSLPPLAVTAGTLVVVGIRYNSATASVSSVTDTAGHAYVSAGLRPDDFVNDYLEIWYAPIVTPHATNVLTVTFTGGTPSFVGMVAGQYSGLASSSALDAVASGKAVGARVDSGFFSTTQADELVVTVSQVAATGTTWSMPVTGVTLTAIRQQDSDHVVVLADTIVSTLLTTTYAAMTNSSTTNKSIAVVTFKAASAPAAVATAQPYVWGPL